MTRAYYRLTWRDLDEDERRRVLDTLADLSFDQGCEQERNIIAWRADPSVGCASDSPEWKRRAYQANNIIHYILGRSYATTSRVGAWR